MGVSTMFKSTFILCDKCVDNCDQIKCVCAVPTIFIQYQISYSVTVVLIRV